MTIVPAPSASSVEPMAVSVEAAARLAGLGRTSLYEALGSGDLPSCKLGKRRLILLEDLRAWLGRHKEPSRPAARA